MSESGQSTNSSTSAAGHLRKWLESVPSEECELVGIIPPDRPRIIPFRTRQVGPGHCVLELDDEALAMLSSLLRAPPPLPPAGPPG